MEWLNYKSKNKGIANYTASWIAPPADVHSQQRFFYLGHRGEVTVDQAHRGYYVSTDVDGFKSVNPLYMRYTPDESGKFVGQAGYGYVSFEVFVDAVTEILRNASTIESFDFTLPTIIATQTATAVLEAGRRSLDQQGKPFLIIYNEDREPIELKPEY